MDNKEKAISLFKYIKELYAQRYQVITDVRKQLWYKFVSDIPQDDENIIFNYMDRTDDDNEVDENEQGIILRIQKPSFEACPKPPKSIEKWIKDGWDQYTTKVTVREKMEQYHKGELKEIFFADDARRLDEYNEWVKQREVWVKRQERIAKTRKFFNELYHCYIDLGRESETIEIMIGQGILSCTVNNSNKIYHPILLKRVALEFDSWNNVLTVVDSNTDPEIYTMLLQEVDYINHSEIKGLTEELSEKLYHPLDRNDTPDFLKSFAHRLHSESKYEASDTGISSLLEKVVIYNNPVFFIRKRTGGVLKALDEIIDQISETGELSGPLLNLLGEKAFCDSEPEETLDVELRLAEISGEDKDILFTKEANREQLQIAKRIEKYDAVVVQGPPGTGKTHTIANLLGHFLAHGKNVLVTSHTRKALSVVKEKVVPELQHLCVSVLEDNNRDMEKSVDGITEYISSHTLIELAENIDKYKKQREQIMSELAEVRKRLFAIRHKEYETIIFGGKGYSVAEAARFVKENQEKLSYLPGKVSLYKPLPVSRSELELLYRM